MAPLPPDSGRPIGEASRGSADRIVLMPTLLRVLPLLGLLACVAVAGYDRWRFFDAGGFSAYLRRMPLVALVSPVFLLLGVVLFFAGWTNVFAIELDRSLGQVLLRRRAGTLRVPLEDVRYVGLRNAERSVSGGMRSTPYNQGGGSHVERVWELHLVVFRGPAGAGVEPPANAPVTQRWAYMESGEWVRVKLLRSFPVGPVAIHLTELLDRPCLFFGEDREPRFVPPDQLREHWGTFGSPGA